MGGWVGGRERVERRVGRREIGEGKRGLEGVAWEWRVGRNVREGGREWNGLGVLDGPLLSSHLRVDGAALSRGLRRGKSWACSTEAGTCSALTCASTTSPCRVVCVEAEADSNCTQEDEDEKEEEVEGAQRGAEGAAGRHAPPRHATLASSAASTTQRVGCLRDRGGGGDGAGMCLCVACMSVGVEGGDSGGKEVVVDHV